MDITEKIKKLLENSLIFEDDEKQEWFELLPKMTGNELSVLHQILVDEALAWKKEGYEIASEELLGKEEPTLGGHGASLEAFKSKIEKATPKGPVPSLTPKEIKREVATAEIPASLSTDKPQTAVAEKLKESAVEPEPKVILKTDFPLEIDKIQPQSETLRAITDIKTIDDLKRVQVYHLRQGVLRQQVDQIKSKIAYLASANKILPFHVVAAFEQSPLFKVYLTMGALLLNQTASKGNFNAVVDMVSEKGFEALSFEEFGVMADLRKEIERM